MLNSKKLIKIVDLQKLAYQSMFDDVKKSLVVQQSG